MTGIAKVAVATDRDKELAASVVPTTVGKMIQMRRILRSSETRKAQL